MHISHFICFASDITCCLFYIYFRLEMLDKRQVQVFFFFFFEFKMRRKAVKTTGNINNTFGPVTATTGTVQWWLVQEVLKRR